VGDLVGRTLGRFRVSAPLGAGGMGEVWRARDERLDRDVALKVLPAAVADDPDRLERFGREARALARLSHPNILAIHDFGEDQGITYAITELLEGETLRERLARGPLPWREATEITASIADGLASAHDHGVVHRDLKPENLFLTSDGRVKVLDFGLARLELPEAAPLSSAPTETAPGRVLGTVGYMAPEQARGRPADHRSDLFALGCLLYEMLSGERAFVGETCADVLAAILGREPAPLSHAAPGVPPSLHPIVERCLRKAPEQRFQSAGDLAFALRSLSTAPGSGSGPHRQAAPGADDRPSIAVLPFANLSADPEQEYFCDGTAEEIINALARVQGLRVVARTSAFAFKGKNEDVREIGRRLDVAALLEGSVRRSGDRLRVTAQLVDVRDGSPLWSERFDRRLEDVFAIQDEIALAIVEGLKVRLLAGEKASLVHRHTESVEAHNAYLGALFEWNRMTPEGFARCQELLREAIRLDPEFAPAYARLADSFTSVTWWADLPPAEALAQARPLVMQALALDPHLAHAHSVTGQYSAFFERDRVAAEHSFRRAVELAPSDASAQTYLAIFLMVAPRAAEASERARLALRLDPLSPTNSVWAGIVLAFSGHPDEGLSVIERQVTMTPHLWMPRYFQSLALATRGRLAEARPAAESALELSGGSSLTLSHLALVCYRLGDRPSADALVARLEKRLQAGYVSPMLRTWVHLARGEADRALATAAGALDGMDPWVTTHRLLCPALVPADPQVEALLAPALP
jgi:TolB-like protein/Flp pilus assembly protein TadD